jgi:hypothetical protein
MVSDIISLNSLDTTYAPLSCHPPPFPHPDDECLVWCDASGQLASDILAQIPDELDSIAISETKKYEATLSRALLFG